MYNPVGNATQRSHLGVEFAEAHPAARHAEIVHRVVALRTTARLQTDYRYHALPDACTYVIFDAENPSICGVTRLRATSEEFNLGREFRFLNVRLLPASGRAKSSTA